MSAISANLASELMILEPVHLAMEGDRSASSGVLPPCDCSPCGCTDCSTACSGCGACGRCAGNTHWQPAGDLGIAHRVGDAVSCNGIAVTSR